MSQFFTAGLCIGSVSNSKKPECLRSDYFLNQCHACLGPDDDLYLVGDLVGSIQDLKFYDQLPNCRLHIVPSATENAIPNFQEEVYKQLPKHRDFTTVQSSLQVTVIRDRLWGITFSAQDVMDLELHCPLICGDAAGLWRTRRLTSGIPVINVAAEAWCGHLVSEEMLEQEFKNLMSGSYDRILYGLHFDDAHYRQQQAMLDKIRGDRSTLMNTPGMQTHQKRWGYSYRRVGVLVVNKEGEFLCVEEKRKRGKDGAYHDVRDIWNLPATTALNPTEEYHEIVARCLATKTGYHGTPTGILFLQEKLDAVDPYDMMVFVAQVDGEPTNFSHRGVHSVRWLSWEQIQLLDLAHKLRSREFMLGAIERYLKGKILPLDIATPHHNSLDKK